MVDETVAYRIIGKMRYAYHGCAYREGDIILIKPEDLGGFDMRDLEKIEPVETNPEASDEVPEETVVRRGRRRAQ